MEILKSKATIALIIMILGVSYIGGVQSSNLDDTKSDETISINA